MKYYNNLQQETTSSKKYLIYRFNETDTINELSCGMLNYNAAIPGLLPASTINEGGTITAMQYDITAKHTVFNEFITSLTFHKIIYVFSGIIDALLSADEYMIDLNSVILDLNYIYINPENNIIEMLCIPIENPLNIDFQKNLSMFFRTILFNTRTGEATTNNSHFGSLLTFLNNPDHTLVEYKQMLNHLKTAAVSQPVPRPEPIPVPASRTVDHCTPPSNVKTYSPPVPQNDNVQEQEEPQEDAEDKKGHGWFSLFKGKKSAKPHSNGYGFDVPGQKAEAPAPEPTKHPFPFASTPSKHQSGKSAQPESSIAPYLIRCRNNERIEINKDHFCVGKDSVKADYVISDNPTISHEHIQFIREGNQMFVLDEKSKNHSYINDMYLTKSVKTPIQDRSNLRLSNEDFEFHLK